MQYQLGVKTKMTSMASGDLVFDFKLAFRRIYFLGAFALIAVMAGCSHRVANPSSRLVVVTTPHLADFATQVAGPGWQIVSLVPRGADPHTFEPTAESLRNLSDARMLICIGAGLEGWVANLVDGSQRSDLAVVDVSSGLPLKSRPQSDGSRSQVDPHIWMDPVLVMGVVDRLATEFSRTDPAGEALYKANAQNYQQKLRELDTRCQNRLKSLPHQRRKLVTSHDALGYLADRYDLDVVATVIPHVSTEAAETSAKEFRALMDTIEQAGVPAIFADQNENPRLYQQLASEARVKVVPSLLLDSLGPLGEPTGTYLGTHWHNVDTIARALE
jgi:zinc/manganese transport system substrate-binding protein/manganese/iron transport system substrate-binding protein